MAGLFEGLGIEFWEIALHIINVVILFVVLRLLLYKPISRFMKKREDRIAKQIDEAAQKQSEAEQLKARYDDMVKNAQGLAAEMIEKSKAVADSQAKLIVENANADAQAIIERADKDASNIKRQAKIELREEITSMAVDIAQRVLKREISAADNKRTIDEFFKENEVDA